MLNVICWKWANKGPLNLRVKYTAEHVNRFYNMLTRHLTIPHRVICITDDVQGIDPRVEVVSIWEEFREYGNCYVRLPIFSPQVAYQFGPRFISVDLDCVIVGNVDPIFSRTEDFIIWNNHGVGAPYCGSMFMMNAGCRPQIYNEFKPELLSEKHRFRRERPSGLPVWRYMPAHKQGYLGSDQAVIAYHSPGEATWTAEDGVMSFKFDALKGLPEGARIVFFHGLEDPSRRWVQEDHPWVKDHWR